MAKATLKVGILTPAFYVRKTGKTHVEVALKKKRGIAKLPEHIQQADLKFGMPLDLKITSLSSSISPFDFEAEALNIIDKDMLELMFLIHKMQTGEAAPRHTACTEIVPANKFTSTPHFSRHLANQGLRSSIQNNIRLFNGVLAELSILKGIDDKKIYAEIISAVSDLIKWQGIFQVDDIAHDMAKARGITVETVRTTALIEKTNIRTNLLNLSEPFTSQKQKPTNKKLDPKTERKAKEELINIHPDKTGRPMTEEDKEYMESIIEARNLGSSFVAQGVMFIRRDDIDRKTAEEFLHIILQAISRFRKEIDELINTMPSKAESYSILNKSVESIPTMSLFVVKMLYTALENKEDFKKIILIMLKSGVTFEGNPLSIIESE